MEHIFIDSVAKGIGFTSGAIVAILVGVLSLLGALAIWYTIQYIVIVAKEKVEERRRERKIIEENVEGKNKKRK